MILIPPTFVNRCLVGKLSNMRGLRQYFRGPASQVGYQRERDVTGEYFSCPNASHFFFSGMVGSTGVNGTDDSDELMRKLRAL